MVQESPRTEDKGYAKVTFLEPDENTDYVELTLKSLAEEVRRLQSEGIDLNDIAILVRKNRNIPLIAEYFDKEMNCKIVSDEAFRLDASLAVTMLIDALRYLSEPEDHIAHARLIVSYQNDVLKNNLDRNVLLLHKDTNYLPEAFTDHIQRLRLMPLYELLEELFIIFNMELIENQDAYLFAFFDAVMDYLQKYSPDLDTFIAHWDKKLCGKTIPGSELEGIRIFSIHKSKGLEFHTVLIPFCDWKLENETMNQLVWCFPQEAPYNEIDIVPVTYSSAMNESVYKDDYLNERLQLWVDNLNLMYVAFTRAGKNLLIWSKKGQKNTMSELLINSLPSVAARNGVIWDEEEEPYEFGTLCPSQLKAETGTTNKLLQKPVKLPVKMESLQPDIKFRQSNRSADFILGIEEEESGLRFIDRGQMLHTLFSEIQTEADIHPAIDRLIFEGIIGSREQEEEIRGIVDKAFTLPVVRDWYSGTWRLFNECAIIYKENGNLQVRRPDRVMMKDDRVVVVDFKFGKEQKKYRKQVMGYMDLLKRMGYGYIEGYLWYVDEEIIERV